jgi:signal transduction histidine kinase/CheY-like chemotaxis protein
MTKDKEEIRLPLLIPAVLSFVILLGSSVAAVRWLCNYNVSNDTQVRLSSVERMFRWELRHNEYLMHSIASLLTQDTVMTAALRSQDRTDLQNRAEELLGNLRQRYHIETLAIYKRDLTCYLNVHESIPSDERPEVYKPAQNTIPELPAEGIGIDENGELILRIVEPWNRGSEVLGYIELSRYIDQIASDLEKTLKAEVIFTINKINLNRDKWEKAAELRKQPGNWDEFSLFVVADSTIDVIPDELADKLRYSPESYGTGVFDFEDQGQTYRGGFLLLKDKKDHYIGDIVVLLDVSEMRASQKQMSAMLIGLNSAVAITLSILFSFYVRRIKISLARRRGALESEIQERKRTEDELTLAKNRAEKAEEETRQVNRQLRHSVDRANKLAEKAIVADVAKGQFLANMSHEIRTPMNAIIGFSDILGEEDLTKEQKKHVSIIRDSGKTLLQVINDILDFSKIEAGKMDVEHIECSLKKLLTNIELMMSPAAGKKKLDFRVNYGPNLPGVIRTDPVRVQQCLINLCNNAIKFTDKGHVYVNVAFTEVEEKQMLRFDVEDTGIGIPLEKQKEVFDAFSQADGTHSRKYGGTGLGLSIAKKMIELLGGKISLKSSPGFGSTFSLFLPPGVDTNNQPSLEQQTEQEQENLEIAVNGDEQFTGKVLVAEDTATNQLLIKLLLERLGFEVTLAENGRQAVELASQNIFDIIFMDMQMPEMSGYEATEALRKKGLLTPIIALTASAMKGDENKCIGSGCNAYLCKPVERKTLIETVRRFLIVQESDAAAVGETQT